MASSGSCPIAQTKTRKFAAPLAICALLTAAVGCASGGGSGGTDGKAGARVVKPGAGVLPVRWMAVAAGESQPLLKLRSGADSVSLSFRLRPPRVDRLMYFGEIQNADEQTVPIVVVRERGQLTAVRLEPAWSYDQWQQVVAGPATGEVWGVLEQSEDNRGDDVVLTHSRDSGHTWQLGLLRRPCPEAIFSDIVMAPDGRGRVTLSLDGPCEDDPGLKPGLYHYRTRDGGQHWSGPEYEADSTHPADDVPDDEQPGQGQLAHTP